jgi:hypothetical protein
MMRERARLIANTAYYQGAAAPSVLLNFNLANVFLPFKNDLLVKTSDPFAKTGSGQKRKLSLPRQARDRHKKR